MKDNRKLTPTERAILEKIAKLPKEGKRIVLCTAAGVAAVYAAQQATK